jgi:hypothetical protein
MAKKKLSNTNLVRKHTHSRILRQLILFTIIAIVMFGVVIFDATQSHINALWVISGAVAGIIIGYLVGKIFNIRWHEDTHKVITGVDRLGFVLIVAYIVFRLASDRLLDHLFHGEDLTIMTYSLLGGILIGRAFSVGRRVVAILREQKII